MGQKRVRTPICLLDASVLMFDFEMTMTSITKVLRIELYNNNTNHARGTREQAGRQAGRQAVKGRVFGLLDGRAWRG